jgi:O-antigen/teichoic acid export membrane protein
MDINSKVVSATKWSTITEIAAKLVNPISTIILARLLTPSDFGVMVTAVMVISFAEIFTDAGFQKYLIQKKFDCTDELYKSTNVAFWTNLMMSLFIWLIIILFSSPLAKQVGCDGHSSVIIVSCACIPLSAFSSIQMAVFKRNFDFKTLFYVRIVGIIIPLAITVPLAYIFRSYWALIIGMIVLELSNAILLTYKSPWKPQLYYNKTRLKQMLSFSLWSMFEAISIWATSYIDLFIVGTELNTHYLGVYRTSMTTVGQIMSIITASTTPVLFSSLSRLQDNPQEFKTMFFKFQKVVSILIMPLGAGIYLFRDFITEILLGDQWKEASYFIGLWAVTSSVTVVLAHYCSEVYRSIGRPKISVIVQISQIVFIIPVVLWSVHCGFNFLCEMRSLIRLELILVNFFCIYLFVRITPLMMIKNIFPSIFATSIMFCVIEILPNFSSSILQNVLYILLAVIIYAAAIMVFPKEREILLKIKVFFKR